MKNNTLKIKTIYENVDPYMNWSINILYIKIQSCFWIIFIINFIIIENLIKSNFMHKNQEVFNEICNSTKTTKFYLIYLKYKSSCKIHK